jgi:2-oxoglutarate dehydrogenase E1 component
MMQLFQQNSYLFGGNAPYVEELYEQYLNNPASVPDNWRSYFDKLQNVPTPKGTDERDIAHAPVVESFAQRAKANAFLPRVASSDLSVARKQVHVQSLIAAYRFLGSQWADLDPLKRQERPHIPELEPGFYDFTEADMDQTFSPGFARYLLRHPGRRIHVYQRSGTKALAAGAARVDPFQA